MLTRQGVIAAALRIAQGEIGVKESGSNRGRKVDEYQRADTLGGVGYPWCASFCSWILQQTESVLDIDIPWNNSASCDVVWADAKARGLIRSNPQAGDMGLVRGKRGAGYSNHDAIHIFIVQKVEGSHVITVEGNTNAGGGREGVAVMSHRRPISERFAWVRWIDGVTLPQAAKPLPWTVRIESDGAFVTAKTFSENGTNFIAAGDVAAALGVSVAWNANENSVILDGREVPTQPRLVGGKSYFRVRDLAEHMGLDIAVNTPARVVTLTK